MGTRGAGLQGRDLQNEQKRLLHNREARTQGYHVLGPLKGPKRDQQPRLRCINCKLEADIGRLGAWSRHLCDPANLHGNTFGPRRTTADYIKLIEDHNVRTQVPGNRCHVLHPYRTGPEYLGKELECSLCGATAPMR